MAFANTPYACPSLPAALDAAAAGGLIRYIGDDWVVGSITIKPGGVAMNLTGTTVSALFFQMGRALPVLTLTEGAGITVASDRTTGVIQTVKVPRATTAAVPAQDRSATIFPTRLQLDVTDAAGNGRTYALILFLPLDPRVDVPPLASNAP